MKIDYTVNAYCSKCIQKLPYRTRRCPVCGLKVRQNSRAKELDVSEGRISQILKKFINEEIKEIKLVHPSLRSLKVYEVVSWLS